MKASRRLFFLFVLPLLSPSVKAQVVNIIDPKFLSALIYVGVDKNKSGTIELEEALLCDTLEINTIHGITDPTGIESFVNLEYLNISQNNISFLDVSQNKKLRNLDLLFNKVEQIDVSNNLELQVFHCGGNAITSLDISKNAKLYELRINFNNISNIDVSNLTELVTLNCLATKLTSLDVSKNTKLNYLDVTYISSLTSICVFDTTYAKSNLKFKKDATQKWTQNCTVTSIATEELETNNHEQIVYPNPASHVAYLKIPNLREPVQLKITDMSGKTMFEQLVSAQETEINTSQLSPGTYYVSFVLNNKVINKKMTVMK